MKDEKKTSLFGKIFGRKSSCCSLELEEVDSNEERISVSKDPAANGCCCASTDSAAKKDDDVQK